MNVEALVDALLNKQIEQYIDQNQGNQESENDGGNDIESFEDLNEMDRSGEGFQGFNGLKVKQMEQPSP